MKVCATYALYVGFPEQLLYEEAQHTDLASSTTYLVSINTIMERVDIDRKSPYISEFPIRAS